MSSRDELISSLVNGAKTIENHRLVVAGAGNLSVRDGSTMLITCAGLRFAAATPADITTVEIETAAYTGLKPSSETGLHLGLYRSGSVKAVVHFHGRFSAAIGTILDELPAIHYVICRFGGPVPVVDYHLFGSTELAAAVHEQVDGTRSAVLLRNHGAVVWADDVESAVEKALLLEWLCEVYWRASLLGTPTTLSLEQLKAVVQQSQRMRYGVREAGAQDT